MAPGSSSGTEKVKASNDYIAGVAAGVATVLIGHPFDTIKVKLQTQRRNAQASQYRNGVHCLMQIVRGEGARGLYRGATPSFVGMSLESALLFGIYTQLRSTFQAGDEKSPLLYSVLPAGFLAGASVSTVLCPTELVKCRLQAQVKRGSAGGRSLKVYDGPVDCVLRTLRSEGVQGLFRGLTATFAREAFGNSAFFLTYEFTRSHMLSRLGLQTNRVVKDRDEALVERGSTSSMYTNHLMEAGVGIASGGLAGIAFWLVVLPIDVAKTRIQISEESHQSRNPLVHLRAIHKDLGIRGLYAGLGPTLIRAFPANAASIVTWEVVSKFLAGNF
ncbi:hypothetical protein MPTK1_1g21910 [Marchantia polymorpha subsp. ruderalis]|uniref:Uncharacterized protein n=2 Tax=Marchantia polymorpha TaxID=3197 RepID=A0AAF6ASW3_MARPO|nr:hypothetical protein MARPO_0001s0527 [Marchantia polymorpha]BBM99533.1 hypothetical protein Mp_1g21910 [Marchantia polymorpha subsp. ruderalis]|eukprot:PTQ50616.1 hypothetical protein MARPO_0001s0527 [Marchantia polymorpha]